MTRSLLLALLAVLALVGGCGLSEDSEPKAIAPEDLPPDLLDPNPDTSTTISELPGTPVSVFLLAEVDETTRLVEVKRRVPDINDPGDRLVALFYGDGGVNGRIRGESENVRRLVRKMGMALGMIQLRQRLLSI